MNDHEARIESRVQEYAEGRRLYVRLADEALSGGLGLPADHPDAVLAKELSKALRSAANAFDKALMTGTYEPLVAS